MTIHPPSWKGLRERMAKRSTVVLACCGLLVASLASAGYAARNTHVMEHWHPMFMEPALGYFGLSFVLRARA